MYADVSPLFRWPNSVLASGGSQFTPSKILSLLGGRTYSVIRMTNIYLASRGTDIEECTRKTEEVDSRSERSRLSSHGETRKIIEDCGNDCRTWSSNSRLEGVNAKVMSTSGRSAM